MSTRGPSFGSAKVLLPAGVLEKSKTFNREPLGLAPEADPLGPPLPKTAYKGLTKYFTVERGGMVPKRLAKWGRLAYRNAGLATTLPQQVGE